MSTDRRSKATGVLPFLGDHVQRSCTCGIMTLGWCLAIARPVDGAPPLGRLTNEGVAIGLTLLDDDHRISAGEPLLARITLTSDVREPTQAVTSIGGASCLHLRIFDDRRHVVAATPRPGARAGGYTRVVDIAHGQPHVRIWIVTGLYAFEKPGEYRLLMQLLSPWGEHRPVSEAEALLQVEPFDAGQLEARCEELFAPIRKHSTLGELNMGCRAKALYSVRNDIVLPYLDWMAREWSDNYACRAIQRVGTPRAQQLLTTLQSRNDKVGKAARSIPDLRGFRMWDLECH